MVSFIFWPYFEEWLQEQVECAVGITEAGKQPEQPRSKTSGPFSISTIKVKTLLSKEFRLRTTNEKGMTQTGLCYKEKELSILWFWAKFPAQLHDRIAFIP